jgi:two-component system, OmpR family, phosphate regulon sensor histidine kinase PhoR
VCGSYVLEVKDVTVQVAGGEQLWQLTVEHSPVGTTLVAPDGRLLSANQALCDMLGYTEPQIRALTFQQITHPDDLAEDLALVDETLAGLRSSYRLRKRYLHADGHVVHGDLSVALLREPDGTPIHFISQILDVTEAHEYAERLAETSRALDRQRRHLEVILDSVDVGVAVLDSDSGYAVVNRRHQQYIELAYPNGTEFVVGQPGDIFAEDGRQLEAHELPSTRAAAGEEFDDVILRVGTDPVTQRALSVSARSVRGDGGEFSGAVLAYADVTELVRALTAKDHFVAAVSHELRTPLTSVLGHLELLADLPDLSDEASDRVRVVQRNAVRLRELVADLLLVAQMTDGNLALNRLPVNLADLVIEAADAAQPAAQGAGVSLDVEVPDGPLVAKVDGPRVRQVIDNLLGNAVKYTEPGGSISVRLRQRGAMVELAVSDTGIGVAPEEVGRLFRRFFRGAQATQRHIPGAGLGLSIVRAIVEAHGGLVTVDSTPGEGSTFRVELPVVV